MKKNKSYQKPEIRIIRLEAEGVLAGSTDVLGNRTPGISIQENTSFWSKSSIMNSNEE